MKGINKSIIMGNISFIEAARTTAKGTPVLNFSIATNSKDAQGKDVAEFHRITAYGKVAETIIKFKKVGQPLYVEGPKRTTSFMKDGQKVYSSTIVVDTFDLVA
jgi:single-strand DNA-binding protein